MRQIFLLISLLSLSSLISAQELKLKGRNTKEIIPQGWEIISESQGDLNKDGIADLAFITRNKNKDKETDTNDYTEENGTNDYTLAIYWGTSGGDFSHYKDWTGLLTPEDESFSYDELNVEITSRGTLKLKIHGFISAGSWTNPNFTVTYRYQKGAFYKIGYDSSEFHRGTGEGVKVSINYSTGKRYVEPFSISDDENQKGYWETLKGEEKILKRLGEETW